MVGIAFLLLLSVQFVLGKKCILGWHQYGKGCFGFIRRPMLNWEVASRYCTRRHRARLAEINNTGLNNWLHGHFRNDRRQDYHIWIGATSRYTQGELVWVPSGRPVLPYVNWLPSEPDNSGPKKCALLHRGAPGAPFGWKSEDCNKEYPSMCVKPLVIPLCEWQFAKARGKCFAFTTTYLDWRSAVEVCRSMRSDILELDNEDINTWTEDLLRRIPDNYTAIWIGGSSLFTGGNWVWLKSHRPMQSFSNFYPGEPKERPKPNGIVMHVKTGKWCAASRKNIDLKYFCEKHI